MLGYYNYFNNYLSDHSLIFISLSNNFNFNDTPKLSRNRQSIDRINYSKVTFEQWNEFKEILGESDPSVTPPPGNSYDTLKIINTLINNIERSIISSSKNFSRIIQGKKHIDKEAQFIKNLERIIHKTRSIGTSLL